MGDIFGLADKQNGLVCVFVFQKSDSEFGQHGVLLLSYEMECMIKRNARKRALCGCLGTAINLGIRLGGLHTQIDDTLEGYGTNGFVQIHQHGGQGTIGRRRQENGPFWIKNRP